MKNLDQLREHSREMTNLGSISGLLGWDQEVMMPEKGISARKQQLSVLSGLQHDMVTSDELKKILESMDTDELNEEDQALYREIKREHDRASKVPRGLQQKLSEKSSETVKIWQSAKAEDDFESVRPHLEELVELKRRYAEEINPEKESYAVLFKDYEPYIPFEDVERVMDELGEELSKLYNEVEKGQENIFKGSFPEQNQKKVLKQVIEKAGFDFDRGRLDVSEHPFTSGNQFDTRITTRFNEKDFSEGLMAGIHEFGHALYEQGLPQDKYGLPTGSSRDLAVHESQSRLWENHIGRSKEFWKNILPILEEELDFEASPKECYNSINRVKEESLIRVYADEISYHLHVVLRFEIGRALINGEIEVEELPETWNDKMEELLNVRPESDAEGCLQDIHWMQGMFGYFPTYSLGTVLAAQINSELETEIEDLASKIEQGKFEEIRDHLKENIHSKGCLLKTEDLIEELVGGLDADEFIDYLSEKYE